LKIGTALRNTGTEALTPPNIQKTNAAGKTTAKAATLVIPVIHAANAANATHGMLGTLGIRAEDKTLPVTEKRPKPSIRDSIHRIAHTSGGQSANLAAAATTAMTGAAVAIPTNARREAVVNTVANCRRPLLRSFFRAKG
jgi:hypothetical protein